MGMKPNGDRRIQVNLRCNPQEKADWQECADDAGVDLSAWLKMIARKAVKRARMLGR